tara:strand:- start:62 stop:289 length:228 start_codon:yes stop_codon:yes gene_type:complete
MGKITRGDITSGEYTIDQKDSIPVGQERMPKAPTGKKRRDFLPVDKLPKDKKIKDFLLEQRKSGAGYSGTEDYKQ